MGNKLIKLSRTYEEHGKVFDTVELREPKLRDFITIGEPVELHAGPNGEGRFVVEHGERIEAYLDRLSVAGKPGREMIDDLDLIDAMAVKEALKGFFLEARAARSALTN